MASRPKPPTTVEIGPHTYTFEYSSPVREGEEFLDGRIDYKDQVITIDSKLKPSMMKQTVLHEVLHGVFFNTAVYPFPDRKKLTEHDAIHHVEAGLFQVIRNNPDLMKWLEDKN